MSVNVVYTAGAIGDGNTGTTDGRLEVARPAKPFVDHGINAMAPAGLRVSLQNFTRRTNPGNSAPSHWRRGQQSVKEPISTPDPIREMPAFAPERGVW
jgi:hypothetical protein